MKTVLTIAGSDCSGGAGIQTDLKTFSALGVYGMSVITAITAQNTVEVSAIEEVSPEMVGRQIDAIFEDIEVDAVKIGMLSNSETIEVVFEKIEKYQPKNIVLDPVMISTSGCDLIGDEAKRVLVKKLIPKSEVITPNLSETREILKILNQFEKPYKDEDIDSLDKMKEAGIELVKRLNTNVLIKGGHLYEDPCDVLVKKDFSITVYKNRRIDTKNTHGTGCTLSSALASYLARGDSLVEAMEKSKEFITEAIENSIDIGRGSGPTNPMGKIYKVLEGYYE